MAGAEPERTFTEEMLAGEGVTKKDIIKFLHENATFEVRYLLPVVVFV